MANYNLTQTGAQVQAILNTVAAGYIYMGTADLTTTPDTTYPNVCYLLTAVGTYTNFGNIAHSSGIGIALWNGTAWSYQNVPSSAVVYTDAAVTENSANPVQSGGVWNSLQYSVYNPLAGMTLGNKSYDQIIGTTLKGIWIEILDQSVTLPTNLQFALYRNRASGGWFFQMVETGTTAPTLFSSNGSPKLTGKNDIVINGYGTFANKVKVHLSLDFTNSANDINFGSSSTNTTFLVSSMNRAQGVNISLKEKIGELDEAIADTNEELDAAQSYSNAFKGVEVGDPNFYTYVKQLWVEILDDSITIPKITKIQFKNYASGSVQYLFTGQDENDNYIFSSTRTTILEEGLLSGAVLGYGSYRGALKLHYTVDVPSSLNLYTFANTSIDISELNTQPTETYSVKEKIYDLSAPLNGKTIVCFGDSITEFGGETVGAYPQWIGFETGANVINIGVGGTQLRQRTTPVLNPSTNSEGYAGLDIVNAIRAAARVSFDSTHTYMDIFQNAADYIYTSTGDDNRGQATKLSAIDWSKVSAVTIMGGTNDWQNGGGAIGTSGSEDPNYTLGAINLIVKTLLTAYPHLSVYWLTPIVHWAAAKTDRTESNWGDVDVRNGYTLKAFSALLSEEVTKQHLPVCDLYNTLGWNMWNFSNYFSDTDGTHPAQGYDEMGRKIAAFIIANRTF